MILFKNKMDEWMILVFWFYSSSDEIGSQQLLSINERVVQRFGNASSG